MWFQTDSPQSTEMMLWECPLLCARGRVSGVGVRAGVSGACGVFEPWAAVQAAQLCWQALFNSDV